MNRKLILITYLAGMIFLGSCQKDIDTFTPNGSPIGADTNWVATVTDNQPINQLRQLLRKDVSLDSLDATAGGTIQTSEGLSVVLPPQVWVLQNGQLATGKIYVESMLLKKKGDLVIMDKP